MHDSSWRSDLARWAVGLGIVALVVATAIFLAYRHRHAEEREQATAYQQEASYQERPTVCIHAPLTGGIACSPNATPADNSERESAYDLRAQQEMADWALLMAIASIFGVAITGVGVVYVAFTLDETRKMTGEAAKATEAANKSVASSERAAKAAEDSVEVTRDTAKRQLRAYLVVSPGGITDIHPERTMQPAFKVANVGQTPASRCSTNCTAIIVPPDFAYTVPMPTVDEVIEEDSVVGPTQGHICTVADVPDTDSNIVNELARGEKNVLVYGCVTYRDVFGERHSARFLHLYKGGKFSADKAQIKYADSN